jgi:hypothetical protein
MNWGLNEEKNNHVFEVSCIRFYNEFFDIFSFSFSQRVKKQPHDISLVVVFMTVGIK